MESSIRFADKNKSSKLKSGQGKITEEDDDLKDLYAFLKGSKK